mmetsp:Transcript_14680/g.30295  ORF Transcript_14680/g.30295 Transcript_14680/m.30295 type:complete len:244 (-) Transcript_14680:48-779(-)
MVIKRDDSLRSVGSTLTVDSAASSSSLKQSKKSSKKSKSKKDKKKKDQKLKKQVSFDLDENEYICNHQKQSSQHETKDPFDTWYTYEEMQQFRSDSQAIIQQALQEQEDKKKPPRQRANLYAFLLELYRLARQEDHMLVNAMDLLASNKRQVRQLQKLYHTKDERILELMGLETQIVLTLKKDVKFVRQSVQTVVADIQEECQKGLWSPHSKALAQEFRDSCLNYTQAPGLWAQLMAQAHQGC